MLECWMPYGVIAANNIIFQLEWRRLRTFPTKASVHKYNRWVVIVCLASVILWWPIHTSDSILIALLPYFASFLLMLIGSFYTVFTAIGPLHQQVTTQQWDLLRMTPQHEEKILMAVDGVAQLRAWRIAALELALRLASLVIPFAAVTLELFFPRYPEYRNEWFGTYFCFTAFFIVAGILYTVEPILRMRALVAMSLYIAMRVQTLTVALLAGFGAALFLHVLQIVAVGLLAAFLQWGGGSEAFGYALACILPTAVIVQAGALLYLYAEVRAWGLRLALRHVFAAR